MTKTAHLNIGSYTVMNPGNWINIDILDLSQFAIQKGFIFRQLDVTKGMSFPDNSIDIINASHFIEHITREEGYKFIRDCFRILQPRGIIRLTVPDPLVITQDYLKGNISRHASHNEDVKNSPDDAHSLFHLLIGGHKSIYDEQGLTKILKEIGFVDIQKMKYQKSKSPIIEKENTDVFPDISLYLEAIKPEVVEPIITYAKKNKLKIAVCTFYTPEFRDNERTIEDFAKYSMLNIRHYCRLHGYDFIERILSKQDADSFTNPKHPHISWYKEYLISEVLNEQKYDWVFWIDSDVAITNLNTKLEDIINDYADDQTEIMVTQEETGCKVLSAGIMLVRNSEWTRSFIKDLYNTGQLNQACWYDQDTFHLYYFGYHQNSDSRYNDSEEVRKRVKVLKHKVMNSFPDIWSEGDFLIHYAGRDRAPIKRLSYLNDQFYVPYRDRIPELLNDLKLEGEGVEVGVQEGLFAEKILQNSKLNKLYLVDPWKHIDEKEYNSVANVNNDEQEKILNKTKDRLKEYINDNRVNILRTTSEDGVKSFEDNQLDFVYIDANHEYSHVIQDIKNWYPKVKDGGIIAGHDYLNGTLIENGIPKDNFGVKQAVLEFFGNGTDRIYVTSDDFPSWYVIKNGTKINLTKTKLKIALISSPFFQIPPKGYSGLEMIVWDLACGLDKLGHEVTIFGPKGSKSTPNGKLITFGPGIDTVGINWFEEENKRFNFYKDIITPEKYDLVHDHSWFSFIYLLKHVNPKLNVAHTHHGHMGWESPPPFKNPNLICISKWMKDITEYYFRQRGFNVKCEYVRNCIDIDKYRYQAEKSDRLLFVGRLSTFKQPHLAIEVARKTGYKLDIIGGSKFVDSQEYVRQLEESIKNDPNIKLYKDSTHQFKIEKMQNAKALLFPSNMGEPAGLVSMESMSCGTPVIALNDGAISEYVIHGKTGFICKNIEEMIEAVGRIHTIKPEDCRRHVEENHSRDKLAKDYLNLYYRTLRGDNW